MKDIVELIKTNRPKLSESSIKTYVNCLKNLFKDVFPSKEFDFNMFFTDYDKVLDHLKKIKFNVRKTILSALVVVSQNKEKIVNAYRAQMMEDAEKYNAIEKENKMTDTQKEAWISWAEILEILEKLKNKYYYILKLKDPSKEDLLDLQKYVILSVYTQIPPRRSQDYCLMKTGKFNALEDNYYYKGEFVFRKFKTAKFVPGGVQSEKVPKSLQSLLNKWVKIHKQDYLFTDYYGKPLTSSGMSKILNGIFKKNISVNMLRHIYITDNLGDQIKDLEKKAEQMGHTPAQQKLYIKLAV